MIEFNTESLYIKLSAENIKARLKIGDTINVSVLKKQSDGMYLVKIKNSAVEAFSNMGLKKGDLIKLRVESTHPKIILKMQALNASKPFMPSTKNAELLPVQIKTDEVEKSIKQLVDYLKNTQTAIQGSFSNKNAPSNNLQNFFIQLPLIINNMKKTVYIKHESIKKNNERGIRLTLYAESSVGTVKLDALYFEKHTYCTLSAYGKKSFELLKNAEEALKTELTDRVSFNISLIKERPPAMILKGLDIKI